MLEAIERLGLHCEQPAVAIVTLNHEQRERGRLKLVSDQGEEVRVFLERGKALLVGEYLRSRCGQIIQVRGATEAVAHASCEDWHTFSRACYHLGNRHTKVEVGDRWLRIKPDHVLEDMLHQIGLVVSLEQAVFNPENGAYAHGHHHH
ncbi:urease accessory protein UreE [Reinekea thalattae]|uniref:Urease accessory protein UreE n=1 Tax=Reinekea thalattae TaxID=2593301 RepID=A0A5C8Z5Z8_9GAMM|nr:urease accessory protein UreE [Reinekea thalattae]TXR53392.1 urease accessory protein UreE [Reinekea thalattae]